MIWEIVKLVMGIGGTALENYQEKQKVRVEAEVAIERAKAEAEVARLNKLADAEISWDQTVATQMERTWKDEWFVILLSVPAILAFTGEWGRQAVAEGFTALDAMPDWYAYSFMAAIAASFGIRQLINMWKK